MALFFQPNPGSSSNQYPAGFHPRDPNQSQGMTYLSDSTPNPTLPSPDSAPISDHTVIYENVTPHQNRKDVKSLQDVLCEPFSPFEVYEELDDVDGAREGPYSGLQHFFSTNDAENPYSSLQHKESPSSSLQHKENPYSSLQHKSVPAKEESPYQNIQHKADRADSDDDSDSSGPYETIDDFVPNEMRRKQIYSVDSEGKATNASSDTYDYADDISREASDVGSDSFDSEFEIEVPYMPIKESDDEQTVAPTPATVDSTRDAHSGDNEFRLEVIDSSSMVFVPKGYGEGQEVIEDADDADEEIQRKARLIVAEAQLKALESLRGEQTPTGCSHFGESPRDAGEEQTVCDQTNNEATHLGDECENRVLDLIRQKADEIEKDIMKNVRLILLERSRDDPKHHPEVVSESEKNLVDEDETSDTGAHIIKRAELVVGDAVEKAIKVVNTDKPATVSNESHSELYREQLEMKAEELVLDIMDAVHDRLLEHSKHRHSDDTDSDEYYDSVSETTSELEDQTREVVLEAMERTRLEGVLCQEVAPMSAMTVSSMPPGSSRGMALVSPNVHDPDTLPMHDGIAEPHDDEFFDADEGFNIQNYAIMVRVNISIV